ncbi:histidine utilization repressor [Tardiphaga sp. OK245]|uniref:histidine utilization repressor n=1 Tax=Tardiphaga sp. OK245 TaxID=1855306 RepID=UPI0008A7BE1C|nr:histidine utilization repressor [Tardiphaga sp. OK245]SEI22953.1 transcriptional regulator, GntR family [Tardiphaga sp. OK245]
MAAARVSKLANGKAQVAPQALYQRIRADLEEKILSGRWPPGYRIPFEHELVESYNCSRMTVNKVLSGLAAAGVIERKRRVGSFVAKPLVQSAVLHIPDIQAEIAKRGEAYAYELLTRKRRKATKDDLERLGIDKSCDVLVLSCRHIAKGRPFALEERLINLDVVPPASEIDFTRVPPGTWLLGHVPWNEAEHRITASLAGDVALKALTLKKPAACLVVERRTWRKNKIITSVRVTYPNDLYQLTARFTPTGLRS